MKRETISAVVLVTVAAISFAPGASAHPSGHKPTVTLTAPAPNATLHGVVTMSADASPGSSPLSRVDFLVDGHTVGSASSSPWSISWNSASVSDGQHKLSARAYDSKHESGSSSVTSATTHNTAPQTWLTSQPANPTFDTSGSISFASDAANPTFQCSLDGAPTATCTSPVAFSGLAPGTHTFTVAAVDQYGSTDPTPAQTTWEIQAAQSLVANGNFEGTRAGWGSSTAVLTLVNDGVAGGPGALKVAWNGSSSQYAVTSAWGKQPVPAATLGHTYVADAYIRSDTPGRSVCVTIREWANNFGTWVGSESSCVTATGSWQKVPTLYYAPTLAGDGLDLSINQQTAPSPGDSFEVDGVQLNEVAPPAQTQPSDPVLLAAGDISGCWVNSDEQTANIVMSMPWATVQTLGDNAYPDGSASSYNCYDHTWGRFKSRTHPAPGNHDYDTPNASVYYSYFGAAAGNPSQGWYSYDLGTWHVIVLNSNCTKIGGCWHDSPEERWLRNDLITHPVQCTLAVMHHPPFTSVAITNDGPLTGLWDDLVAYHADLLLAGHAHVYERFAPMDANGNADPTGVREITVGTGGADVMPFGTIRPTSEARSTGQFGVLELVLHPGSYDWSFLPVLGGTFTDAGSTACH